MLYDYFRIDPRPLQLATLAILDKADKYDWSVQGLGMLRLYIRKLGRIHIWDSELRYPGASMVHNHSWDLKSTVVAGALTNTQYVLYKGDYQNLVGLPFETQNIVCGCGTEVVSPVEVWGNAIPRRATEEEVQRTVARAIAQIEREL